MVRYLYRSCLRCNGYVGIVLREPQRDPSYWGRTSIWAGSDATMKQEIAIAIAEHFPELAPRLPRSRKPWMSEDYRMSIFDAVALALTFFFKFKNKRDGD